VLCHWFVSGRYWPVSDFLRQASTLSAAAFLHVWQSDFAGEQTFVLSLGLSLRFVCSHVAFMSIFVKTMRPMPNQSPEPTPIASSDSHSRLTVTAARLSFGR
jgi:hypothetical protein